MPIILILLALQDGDLSFANYRLWSNLTRFFGLTELRLNIINNIFVAEIYLNYYRHGNDRMQSVSDFSRNSAKILKI